MGAVALTAVLALNACSSSGATPAQQRVTNPVWPDSVNATLGPLRLLAVRLEAPQDSEHLQDGNVGLFLTVANSASASDTLNAVRSPDATSVVFRDGTAPVQPAITVTVPARGVASLQYPGGPHLELVGLARAVRGGSFIPVTFTFAAAGAVTMNVFVAGTAQPTVAPPSGSSSASSTSGSG